MVFFGLPGNVFSGLSGEKDGEVVDIICEGSWQHGLMKTVLQVGGNSDGVVQSGLDTVAVVVFFVFQCWMVFRVVQPTRNRRGSMALTVLSKENPFDPKGKHHAGTHQEQQDTHGHSYPQQPVKPGYHCLS